MRIAPLILAPLFLVALANAQTPPLPDSMFDEACTVDSAASSTILQQVNAQAPRREIMMENLGTLMELMAESEWEDGTPMIDQMTAAEATRFEELNQKIESAQYVELIEGKRERDLWAISNMASQAEQALRGQLDFEALNEREQVYLAFLSAAEELMPLDDDNFTSMPQMGSCTLENALYAAAERGYDRAAEVYGREQALADLTALSEKYGGGRLDPSVLSAKDLERYEQDILPVMTAAITRINYAQNMYRLATIEKISKVRHRAMQMDQYDAPGDLSYSGTNWDRMAEAGEFSELEVTSAQILYQLNEVIPPDIMDAWSAIVDATGEE